jgi:hypothetical protein
MLWSSRESVRGRERATKQEKGGRDGKEKAGKRNARAAPETNTLLRVENGRLPKHALDTAHASEELLNGDGADLLVTVLRLDLLRESLTLGDDLGEGLLDGLWGREEGSGSVRGKWRRDGDADKTTAGRRRHRTPSTTAVASSHSLGDPLAIRPRRFDAFDDAEEPRSPPDSTVRVLDFCARIAHALPPGRSYPPHRSSDERSRLENAVSRLPTRFKRVAGRSHRLVVPGKLNGASMGRKVRWRCGKGRGRDRISSPLYRQSCRQVDEPWWKPCGGRRPSGRSAELRNGGMSKGDGGSVMVQSVESQRE